MNNYEYYKEEIKKNMQCASVCNIYSVTLGKNCDGDCKNCFDKLFNWLNSEYNEHIKLSKTEYHILKGLDENWKYIARNRKNGIKIHTTEPYKEDYLGSWSSYDRIDLPYEQLFKFIKWEDEEPYSIEELLKCEVVEDE